MGTTSSLIKAYTSEDTNHWTFGLKTEEVLLKDFDVGGTRSKAYEFLSDRSKEDRCTFSLHSVTCNHYGFILSTTPPLSVEFKNQLANLPSHYNSSTKNEYRKFIQTHGTHYFRKVNLGGRLRRVTSSQSCLSSLNGLNSRQVHSCLSMGIDVGLGKLKVSYVPNSCISVLQNKATVSRHTYGLHKHFADVSGGDGWSGGFFLFTNNSKPYLDWLKSLKGHPDVVSYSLRPLYQLVPNTLQKTALKAAIEEYLKDNALKKFPEEPDCTFYVSPYLSSNCCPRKASSGSLVVTIVRGWDLFGDDTGMTDGYATVYYGKAIHRTKMIQSNDPQWNEKIYFHKVNASLSLKIEVWDQDPKYDDLLVSCERYLSPGTQNVTCKGDYGNVEVIYTLTCDPYLTGEQCSQYKPAPLPRRN